MQNRARNPTHTATLRWMGLTWNNSCMWTPKREKSAYSPTSPAVEQAAQLLLYLGKQKDNSINLTTICKDIGIHKSKGFSLLNTLSKYDFIIKDSATKAYSLGPALLPLARKAREKIDINAIAKDHLQKLANETRASALFGIICNDQFYIAGKYDGNDKLSVTVRQHQSLHITHGSHGKAVFSFLDEKEQQRIRMELIEIIVRILAMIGFAKILHILFKKRD